MDRLHTLRVGDVMKRDVTTVSACQSMGRAAAVLADGELSGAPVVDEAGRCVGVLSATDFMRRECFAVDDDKSLQWVKQEFTQCVPGGSQQISSVRGDFVSDWMSPTDQTIAADALLATAANEMCLAHAHRLFVVDEHARPTGVLTSLDVVAALVNVLEEAKVSRPR